MPIDVLVPTYVLPSYLHDQLFDSGCFMDGITVADEESNNGDEDIESSAVDVGQLAWFKFSILQPDSWMDSDGSQGD